MNPEFHWNENGQLTRRDVLSGVVKTMVIASILSGSSVEASPHRKPVRSINIMNFVRAEEPREPMDLFEPVRQQMASIKSHGYPATWLLQYDAIVEGPFVQFLLSEMPPSHEIGFWFEMNRKICDDAGITWRGNPDWEWDYHVPVAYAIGYTPDERRKLADTAVATFKRVLGRDVKSVASWNLDAVTISHLSDEYGVDAFGNCRDQLATDGFTIWGAPIAGYYPCRLNAWSPAVDPRNQINTPMFRLLGQDPVYYYDNQISAPDTMEPVWPSGQSETFVDRFLTMIDRGQTQSFAYAQLGQENSFGWPAMSQAFPMQMEKLAAIQGGGSTVIETMGATGRRFKRAFKSTPSQAQVMLEDPFGNTDPTERTVWYQSKYYRANLHFRGTQFYLRDIHVYNDQFPQPYLTDPVRQHGIEQRLLSALDGYHWSDDNVRRGKPGQQAKGSFLLAGTDGTGSTIETEGTIEVAESGSTLLTKVPLFGGGVLQVVFSEKEISFKVDGSGSSSTLQVKFEWVPTLSALTTVEPRQLNYQFRSFDYSLRLLQGVAAQTPNGVTVSGDQNGSIRVLLAQEG